MTDCNACGSKNANFGYINTRGEEGKILCQFISQKSGKNQSGSDFKLCEQCKKELEKFLSQTLKDKIIAELNQKNLIDSRLLSGYGYNSYFVKDNDWLELQKALVKNIQRYRNEWQIKEMNFNRDGKEYFHPKSGHKVSKLTVLMHQSAPVDV